MTPQSKLLCLAPLSFLLFMAFAGTKVTDEERFNRKTDLLLAHFDCKTDVDDLHSAAGLVTMLESKAFKDINYHVVAGAYGIQEGLYVPANELFATAFGNNWSDAHTSRPKALSKVVSIVKKTLEHNGQIWIAEGGQSDFSAALVREIKLTNPQIDTKQLVHIVQHSGWNEEVTNPADLEYVKSHTQYHKIADGNAIGNGTPGFQTSEGDIWSRSTKSKKLKKIWEMATSLGNKYNGKEGRYNNKTVSEGGLDFSDLSEVCWIMGKEHIKNATEFFDMYSH